jgi:DNA polymerase
LPNAKISQIHGQPHTIGNRLIVPMMHPAAALHQQRNRPIIEEDFRRLPDILVQARDSTESTAEVGASGDDNNNDNNDNEPPFEQLSMF